MKGGARQDTPGVTFSMSTSSTSHHEDVGDVELSSAQGKNNTLIPPKGTAVRKDLLALGLEKRWYGFLIGTELLKM